MLPKSRQEELRYDAMLRGLWVVCALTLASFILVFVAQFGLRFYLKFEAGSIKSEIKELQVQVGKQQNSEVKNKIKELNNLIGDYNNLSQASPKWSKLVKAVVPLIPENVRLNSLNIDPAAKIISISGVSPTREQVIELYNNVLKDKTEFYNINYPLENVAKPKNVSFHFNFYYQDIVIK